MINTLIERIEDRITYYKSFPISLMPSPTTRWRYRDQIKELRWVLEEINKNENRNDYT